MKSSPVSALDGYPDGYGFLPMTAYVVHGESWTQEPLDTPATAVGTSDSESVTLHHDGTVHAPIPDMTADSGVTTLNQREINSIDNQPIPTGSLGDKGAVLLIRFHQEQIDVVRDLLRSNLEGLWQAEGFFMSLSEKPSQPHGDIDWPSDQSVAACYFPSFRQAESWFQSLTSSAPKVTSGWAVLMAQNNNTKKIPLSSCEGMVLRLGHRINSPDTPMKELIQLMAVANEVKRGFGSNTVLTQSPVKILQGDWSVYLSSKPITASRVELVGNPASGVDLRMSCIQYRKEKAWDDLHNLYNTDPQMARFWDVLNRYYLQYRTSLWLPCGSL